MFRKVLDHFFPARTFDEIEAARRKAFLARAFGVGGGVAIAAIASRADAQSVGNGGSLGSSAVIDVRSYGASPTNSATANTVAIQNAINAAIAQNLPLFLKDIYPVNAGSLVWNAFSANIYGESALTSGLSVTNSQNITGPVLTVGNGLGPNGGGTGFFNLSTLHDFGIFGDTAASATIAWSSSLSGASLTNYNAGLLLNGILGCEVRNVVVRKCPIGFNLKNNCYSSSFYNCKTFSGECAVGIYLSDNSGTYGAGNDMTFVNCWLTAWLCAVWIGANGGGYHFYGGQLAAGNGNGTTTADLLGVVCANAQLENPTTIGNVYNVQFDGVSFESPNNVWVYRNLYPGSAIAFRNCGFLCDSSSIGVFKSGSGTENYGYNEHVSFYDCRVTGSGWTSTVPINVNGDTGSGEDSDSLYYEVNTSGYATFSGGSNTDFAIKGMLIYSEVAIGAAVAQLWQLLPGGMLLRNNSGTLQKSTNWGSTWASVP